MAKICYRKMPVYKYQIIEEYQVQIDVKPKTDIITPFIRLNSEGLLIISAHYAWDGPSGPTVDTKNFMRGSLVHDALYQLMRESLLPVSFREAADRELQKICREDGMSAFRAWYVYQGVHQFGEKNARPHRTKSEKLVAP